MTTQSTKMKDIKHQWHLINAKGKILGRFSTQIAQLLMGKRKPRFVRSLDMGDNVVVINAAKIVTTGKKKEQKVYQRYSGYPGGLKSIKLGELLLKKPEEVIRHAVSGMLPKNKLRQRMLTRLHIFQGEDHPYKNHLKQESR